ncbi:carbohydrate ABC transporter permease [Paenibacillus sp. 7124]|uniref:Carbohydrate ABC transporter permease n=1 Tax=Paenibacillus apii TaxID=1850370 RepID=A0A6M1PRM7_9BACL|nr:carbohydrate ABC transporter permease [Paenibacillus apii]NGM82911.1 carbohydrate ABC transporter permease [Paenibacillus apii]NJJ40051.1 carbohydrate ABC transporter permease [Paenibacillus apii]
MKRKVVRKVNLSAKVIILGIWLLFMIFPLYWMILTSLKPKNDIFQFPLEYLPEKISFENYANIFAISKFHVYIGNSLLVSLLSAFIVIVISILSSYVLARFTFRGSRQIMSGFFLTQMIPMFIGFGPLYSIMSQLNLLNKQGSLVLMYSVLLIPFCTLMLKGFFQRIPSSLEEAAMIDGCSRLGGLIRIILPVMKPGISATFIFAFVQNWNELFLAIMFIDREEAKTIPVAMNSFITKFDIDWGAMSAATVLSVIPTMILFALCQRLIVQGLTDGAVKG